MEYRLDTICQTEIVEDLNNFYPNLEASQVLREVIYRRFPNRSIVLSSFGSESSVLLHLVTEINPKTPIPFLDTHKHFHETLEYKEKLTSFLGLKTIISTAPNKASLISRDKNGTLYLTNPDISCRIRKTLPMLSVLKNFDCIIDGRKRFQSKLRSELSYFEAQDQWIKLSALIHWNRENILKYQKKLNLPEHPLLKRGYPSIGCLPCTSRSDKEYREGRWQNTMKTECGIYQINNFMIDTKEIK